MYSKLNLRAFLKNSLVREAYQHAPWLVKEHLAIQYRLPMEIPSHLLQDAKLLANKVYTMPAPTHHLLASLLNVTNFPQQQMLQMKPPKGRRSNKSEEILRQQQELAHMQQLQQQVSHGNPASNAQLLTSGQHPGAAPHQLQQMQNYHQPIATRMEPRPLPRIQLDMH